VSWVKFSLLLALCGNLDTMENTLARRLVAEFIGTALLLVAVVGGSRTLVGLIRLNSTKSSTTSLKSVGLLQMSDRFGAALIAGLVLAVMVVVFGAVSGGHFNPAVSLGAFLFKGLTASEFVGYALAQIVGGVVGSLLAIYAATGSFSSVFGAKASLNAWSYVSEFVATFVLVMVVHSSIRAGRGNWVPLALGGWVVVMASAFPQGYGNPAVTFGSIFNGKGGPTFVGALIIVAVQAVAAVAAWSVTKFMYPQDASYKAAY
jgi:glycerol uptake facilitator-like aquaporin